MDAIAVSFSTFLWLHSPRDLTSLTNRPVLVLLSLVCIGLVII